jgi:hypothetical protein
MIRSAVVRWLAALALPLALHPQDGQFRKIFDWDQKTAPARYQAAKDLGSWILTEEAKGRISVPDARELVQATVEENTVRTEEKGGAREFAIDLEGGKIAAVWLDGLPWPRLVSSVPAEAGEKGVDRTEPRRAAESLLRLRGEAARRLQPARAELSEVLAQGPPSNPTILSLDADRRFALVYLCFPVRSPGEPEFRAVRLRLKKTADGWRVDEEGIYCPDCPDHKACKSCYGKGIMIIGENDKALCIGCRPDGACKRCGGSGYRSGFSLLLD